MKQLLLLVFALIISASSVFAQRSISGKVTDVSGIPLIGANIIVKNAVNVGTITDVDGMFSLRVPAGGTTLVISYTGYTTQNVELGSDNFVSISLAEGQLLDELVVTALNVKREQKSLGYAVQQVSGEVLNIANETNIVNSLAGKVSGIQVISSASANVGGSSKIRIRGNQSLEGGSPLFVIDGTPISNTNFSGSSDGSDYGNLASDLNPDDIESVNVLKGPAATALYGNRASNGVIVITTKKGIKRKGVGVTFSTSFSMDKVYVLPEYQNEYAGGYDPVFIDYEDPIDGKTYKTLDYSADESWGPKIDGTAYRPWWSWQPGADYGREIPLSAHPDNVRDFFNTGSTNVNSIGVNGGNEDLNYRFSYGNTNQKGVIPNSSANKNNIGVNVGYKILDNLTLSSNLNFAFVEALG